MVAADDRYTLAEATQQVEDEFLDYPRDPDGSMYSDPEMAMEHIAESAVPTDRETLGQWFLVEAAVARGDFGDIPPSDPAEAIMFTIRSILLDRLVDVRDAWQAGEYEEEDVDA